MGVMVLLVFAVFVAFGRSLTQGFSPIDDLYLIAQNLAVRGPTLSNLRTIFTTYDPELYIPLTFFSFQLNYLVSGTAPWSYHLGNILLHALNAFLVFLLIQRLARNEKIAVFGALLFAVHPLQTESVVWITIRKDLLSTFFALSSILFYLRGREGGAWWPYLVSIFLFLLALLAKVTVVPLPLVLLLSDVFLERRRSLRALLDKIPYFILSGAFLIIAFMGKEQVMGEFDPFVVFVLSGKSVMLTLQHSILSRDLIPFYEEPAGAALFSTGNLIACALALLFVILTAFVAFRWPRTGFGLLFFLILLVPSFLSPFRAGAIYGTADHYSYLPIVGLMIALCAILESLRGRVPPFLRSVPIVIGGFLIVFLCLLSVRQTKAWDSAESLFQSALEVAPSSVAVRTAYARVLLDQGRAQEAFDLLKEGLRFGDDARLHLAAGAVLAKGGRATDALEQFRIAQEMDPENPEPLFSMGSVEEQIGRTEEALAHFYRALALDSSYVAAELGIGRILFARKDIAGAEEAFRRVLSWNVNIAEAHSGLAEVLVKRGETNEAEMHRLIAEEIEHPSR
jgi:tetratricopeptide (TPR) repeat protein